MNSKKLIALGVLALFLLAGCAQSVKDAGLAPTLCGEAAPAEKEPEFQETPCTILEGTDNLQLPLGNFEVDRRCVDIQPGIEEYFIRVSPDGTTCAPGMSCKWGVCTLSKPTA